MASAPTSSERTGASFLLTTDADPFPDYAVGERHPFHVGVGEDQRMTYVTVDNFGTITNGHIRAECRTANPTAGPDRDRALHPTVFQRRPFCHSQDPFDRRLFHFTVDGGRQLFQ